MARDGVAVDAGLAAAVARYVGGVRVNVSAECGRLGVSRTTFYKYVARFRADGVDGLFPRSRRPHTAAPRVLPVVEDAIVRTRKELADQGWDNGADSILDRLSRHPDWMPAGPPLVLPSRATVHRLLVRRGMVIPQPRKRPRRGSWRRFERGHVNALWQMDGYEFKLADDAPVVVLEVVDDCSRMLLAADAATGETSQAAWTAFVHAAQAGQGYPAQLLTDNAGAFSGARRGWTSALETAVRHLGVVPITCSVGHPQTCGKDERAHQTSQKWLAKQPRPASLDQLQAQLDRYRHDYNTDRGHQGLPRQGVGRLTPAQRWQLGPRTGPPDSPVTEPLQVTTTTVVSNGRIWLNATSLHLGRRYAGHSVTVLHTGTHVTVFLGNQYLRDADLDPSAGRQHRLEAG